jgi:hypothetical protein
MEDESQAAEQLDTEDLTLEGIAAGMEPDPEEEGAEAESSDHDEDNEEAPSQEAAQPDDPEFEVDHGGQKLKLKKSELVAGYMKDADYRRKTAEVAEQRRQAEALVQAVAQERQGYVTRLDTLMQALQSELVDDQKALNELAQSDPAAYIARLQSANVKAQKYREAEAARAQLLELQRQAEARATSEYAKRERQTLLDKLPAWRDEKRAAQEQELIAKYLTSIGYAPDELATLYDHRALLVARDAALYRAQQATRKKVTPPSRAPVRPGAAPPNDGGKSAAAVKAADRLKRNPNDLGALAGFAAARGI